MAAKLRAAGHEAMSLRLDVSDEQQSEQVIRQIIADYGRLDILINNAGTDVTLPLDELSVKDWDRVLTVNLRGPFVMSKHVFWRWNTRDP